MNEKSAPDEYIFNRNPKIRKLAEKVNNKNLLRVHVFRHYKNCPWGDEQKTSNQHRSINTLFIFVFGLT